MEFRKRRLLASDAGHNLTAVVRRHARVVNNAFGPAPGISSIDSVGTPGLIARVRFNASFEIIFMNAIE
jgi:hypothetical protein